jgi:hypothetical protein
MRVMLLTAVVTMGLGIGEKPTRETPLPMAEVEACQIEFTNPIDRAGRWGGQIASYVVRTDDVGGVVSLERQVVKGREHLQRRVRLDQLESCVRRWRFGTQGDFTIALRGGPISDYVWVIIVSQGSRVFRLRVAAAQ